MRRLAALVCVLFVASLAAFAQTEVPEGEDDNGFIINLIEEKLSAPGREIRLSGVSGALSSVASVAEITVSDADGVYFRIENAEIDWSRRQLLRGRIDIERLAAERIEWLRKPGPVETPRKPPPAEAQPFSLPDLPVSVRIGELDVGRLVLDEQIFGQAAELAVSGSLSLADGALDTELAIRRLDGPGGELTLAASFANETRELALDLKLREPQGGIVADLLNIEGEPAIDLSLEGAGPLGDVTFDFALDADGARIAGGQAVLDSTDAGLAFTAELDGGIAPLLPAQYRDFFQGTSAVRVAGVNKDGGGLKLDTIALEGAVLDLNGSLETGSDGFLRSLSLTGTLGDQDGDPVVLPVPGASTRLQSARLSLSYGDAERWTGEVALDRLEAGDITVEDLTLDLGGLARNLETPETRMVTINVEGLATGISAADPDVAAALGDRIDLFVDAVIPPQSPVELNQFQISGNGLSVFTAGSLRDWVYTGRNVIRIAELAPFSGLAGRDLGGGLDVEAAGSVSPLSGGFDLTFDGTATDLAIGDTRLDRLLAGQTELAGRVVRDETGFRTDGLRLDNPQLDFASTGVISSTRTDIGFEAALADLSLIDPRLEGALTATGSATGSGGANAVSLTAEVPQGRVLERELAALQLGFDGTVNRGNVAGSLSGTGRLDDLGLALDGDLLVAGELRRIEDLTLEVGPNTLTGSVERRGTAPIVGELALDAPDVAPLAALALTEASGALDANVALSAGADGQAVALTGTARDLALGGTRIAALDVDARVSDAFGVPLVEGDLEASDLVLGGIAVETLSAEARQTAAERMDFSAESRLAIGTEVALEGELARLEDGFAATLDALSLTQDGIDARLTAPATVTLQSGAITLTPLELDLGSGSLTAEGRLDDAFDLDVELRDVPLDLANAIKPDLALAGTVSGTAAVTGPRGSPDVRFDLAATDLAAAATRNAGLPPISIEATGTTEDGRLAFQADVASGNGLAARASGEVPLGAGPLDVEASLQSFPLALIDPLAGDRGLSGALTGTAEVGGTLAEPQVRFDLRGADVSAQVLRENGVAAVDLTAEGDFADGAVTLEAATLTNPDGLDLSASGQVPLSGNGLDVSVDGTVPLRLANAVLAERDAQASGLVRIDARATGALADPSVAGGVSLAGGTLVDPRTNIRLENVSLEADLEGSSVLLRSFSAEVAEGGRIAAEGRVSLDAAAGYPADLSARLEDVRYTDGTFVTTELSGALGLEGPLVGGGGLISGEIVLGETEISVAEGLGANAQEVLEDVIHELPPPRVVETLQRARVGEPEPPEPRAGNGGIGLDVRISAPSRIFVRGRGLDVELGGDLRLRGTTADIQPVGRFDLRRGRLSVLGQRIEFDEGSLQLIGSLMPLVNFVARTESGDVTAIVTVQGRVTEPQITFSSVPELPQDEVLARVIFNRSTDQLSAFQLAQLAAAAAELAGGGGPGLFSQIREGAGLDDLDIVTEENGNTALRAGKYVSDNVYLDVQADSEGTTRAQVNLDITDEVTARGSVGTDGNTSLGIFYERDY